MAQLFLLHLNENECYHCLAAVIVRAKEDRFFLTTNKTRNILFMETFKDLVREKVSSKLSKHFLTTGTNMSSFASKWFDRMFVGSIPYWSVHRILDTYLNEGNKILYRVGLALLKSCTKQLLSLPHADAIQEEVQAFASTFKRGDILMDDSFSIRNLSRSHFDYLEAKRTGCDMSDSLQDRVRKAAVDEDDFGDHEYKKDATVMAPRLHGHSSIVSKDELAQLWQWLPPLQRHGEGMVLFCTSEHGYNLRTMLANGDRSGPNMVLLKTKDNMVVGAYASTSWKPDEKSFHGNGECFIFRIRPSPQRWLWQETGPYQFMLCEGARRLVMGGGSKFALNVNEDLTEGTTGKCEAFNNTPMTVVDPESEETESTFSIVSAELIGIA
mmetsp:Transcript_21538/g.55941  ORF Transcript_21538/g.55941 Transcript_21538/m.55941 type:complete len:383 (+) Transcript_21538:257-1405(+)